MEQTRDVWHAHDIWHAAACLRNSKTLHKSRVQKIISRRAKWSGISVEMLAYFDRAGVLSSSGAHKDVGQSTSIRLHRPTTGLGIQCIQRLTRGLGTLRPARLTARPKSRFLTQHCIDVVPPAQAKEVYSSITENL